MGIVFFLFFCFFQFRYARLQLQQFKGCVVLFFDRSAYFASPEIKNKEHEDFDAFLEENKLSMLALQGVRAAKPKETTYETDGGLNLSRVFGTHHANTDPKTSNLRVAQHLRTRPKWNASETQTKPRIKYGAWYIPIKKWKKKKVCNDGSDRCNRDEIESSSYYQKLRKQNPQLFEQQKELNEKIPQLFISKAYKQWIVNQQDPAKQIVPQYLQNVNL